jgi:hypothetical protein
VVIEVEISCDHFSNKVREEFFDFDDLLAAKHSRSCVYLVITGILLGTVSRGYFYCQKLGFISPQLLFTRTYKNMESFTCTLTGFRCFLRQFSSCPLSKSEFRPNIVVHVYACTPHMPGTLIHDISIFVDRC